ncbi:MAG: 3-deoxy-8-phosphooctulonate synthase [Chlamydiae bacterium CG10_big_fil_rev_8_21_14_0_10_42_34]|nr:MAG: 3-deoxy-8-phosphooctulonate synthase [Chlamydiae bacterium CG10_big_fil_rev_8_21_14_0_10_42_34]
MKDVPIQKFFVGDKQPLTIFCGPCVIESEEFTLQAAEELKEIFSRFPFQFVFKSSFDKANRTSIDSFRGPGLDEGLKILQRVQKELDLPIITDIHTPDDARIAGEICDVIQIPAFLCRQTDLIIAAGKTSATVNVKKGQFLSPWDMKNVVEKLVQTGNEKIILTDRGTSFGYNNLVSDMRAIPIMQQFGYPVCFDATHSVQLPGGLGSASGGQREFIPTLAKSAIAAGANALFIEAHPNPALAKSDASSVMAFDDLKTLLSQVERLYEAVQCSSVSSH